MQNRVIKLLIISQLLFVSKNFSQSIAANKINNLGDAGILSDVSSSNNVPPMPKMTTAQIKSIKSPAVGLIVYNTSIKAFQINSGTDKKPSWTILNSTVGAWLTNANTVAVAEENTDKESTASVNNDY